MPLTTRDAEATETFASRATVDSVGGAPSFSSASECVS
jgi:hypothetical protein